jgi:hypothetical protein
LFAVSSALRETVAGADTGSQLLCNGAHLDNIIGDRKPLPSDGYHPAGERFVKSG